MAQNPKISNKIQHATYEVEFGKISTKIPNDGGKAACKDVKSKKKCKKLKKANNGNGCKKKSTMKNCQKTCGLCDTGKFFSMWKSFQDKCGQLTK